MPTECATAASCKTKTMSTRDSWLETASCNMRMYAHFIGLSIQLCVIMIHEASPALIRMDRSVVISTWLALPMPIFLTHLYGHRRYTVYNSTCIDNDERMVQFWDEILRHDISLGLAQRKLLFHPFPNESNLLNSVQDCDISNGTYLKLKKNTVGAQVHFMWNITSVFDQGRHE